MLWSWFARNVRWLLFGLPGLALLAGALVTGFIAARFHVSAERAQGTVVGNTYISRSDRGGSYHPQVEFSTPDGQHHKFVGSMGSSPAAFIDGDRVPVLYDPKKPEQAAIDTWFQLYSVPLICFVMGCAFTLAGGTRPRTVR